MIGMEDVIQRHGIKRALQKTKVAVSKINAEDTDEFDYYDLGGETERKKKTNSVLKRNLKRAMSNQEFRDNDPCNCGGSDWYTFANENCSNELDEVVVIGVDKSKRRHKLNTNLVKKDHWWNKSIDVSFKNPWPEARWDWFENRQSGDFVWGSNRSGNEGRTRGINGKIYNSYQGDDFTPGGGGASMKFWGHLDNWAKYGIKAVQVVSGGIEQGNNVDKAIEILKEELIQKEAIVEALRIRDSLNFNHSTQIRKDTLYRVDYWKNDTIYGGQEYNPTGNKNLKELLKDIQKFNPKIDSVSLTVISIK